MEQKDIEKILIEREYIKHKEKIQISKDREVHLKYKNIGYTEAKERFTDQSNLINLLIGYIKSRNVEDKKIKEMLYYIVKQKDVDIESCILDIINTKKFE